MDESFIIVSIITTLGGICGLLLLDRNWFRRERFKLERDTLKQENNLRFKKMARDMGLSKNITPPSVNSGQENSGIASFLPLLSQLAPNQIGDIVGILSGKTSQDEAAPESEEGGLPAGLDGLLEFASKNPELVKGFLSGMNKEGGQGQNDLI